MKIDENTSTPQLGEDGSLTVDTDKCDQRVYWRLVQSIMGNPRLAWDISAMLAEREGYYLIRKGDYYKIMSSQKRNGHNQE